MYGIRLNLIVVILICALGVLQYRLWFEAGGVKDMLKLKKSLALQMQENDHLKQRNEALLFQIERLKNNQDAIESRARSELGMIKKDETFYQIVQGN
jgi:cell division protein FtsB